MLMPTTAPPVSIPPESRRLLIGLGLSFVLHLTVVTLFGASPGKARLADPQPLLVELRQVAAPPQPAAELATEKEQADAIPEQAAAAPSETRPREPVVTPQPEASSSADLPLDRYFTARELDVRAEPINDVELVYPVRAYQMRIRGKVVLRMFINERGGIDEVTVLESAPAGVFEEAAVTATLALQFKPAVRNGRNVKSQKTIEVVFDPYERINTP